MQDFRILSVTFILILFLFYVYLGFKFIFVLLSVIVLISFIIFIITRGTTDIRKLKSLRIQVPGSVTSLLAPGIHHFNEKAKVTESSSLKQERKQQYFEMNKNTSFNMSYKDTSLAHGDVSFGMEKNQSNTWSSWRNKSSLHPSLRPRKVEINRRHSFSVRPKHVVNQSPDVSLNSSFIPSIKRALGLESISNSRSFISSHDNSYTSHPAVASPGFFPAVRLGHHNKYNISQKKPSAIRNPNTVKIAPPDPQKLCSPRLLEVKSRETTPGARLTPDTQSVLTALKEKSRKRAANTVDQDNPYADLPQQKAKRRRQESQQSNDSTSSLPPLPDNLPDLSMSGYSIPRLETPTLKRPALSDSLDWGDEEQLSQPKRSRREGRYNSIISSLSSTKRLENKESRSNKPSETELMSQKRKVPAADKENSSEQQVKLSKKAVEIPTLPIDRSDTVIVQPDFDATDNDIQTSAVADISLESSQSLTPKHTQRICLNKSVSVRKRQMSFYSNLNKSFTKVPQANVIASMEDYAADREAEQNRVQQMLDDISSAEVKSQEKKESQTKLSQITLGSTGSGPATSTSTSIALTTAVTLPVTSSTSTPTTGKDSVISTTASQPNNTFTPVFGAVSSTASSSGTSTVSTVFGGISAPSTVQTSNPVNSGKVESKGAFFSSAPVSTTTASVSSSIPSLTNPPAYPTTSLSVTNSAPSGFGLSVSTAVSPALPSYDAAVKNLSSVSATAVSQHSQPPGVVSSQPGFQFGGTTITTTVPQTSSGSSSSGTAQFSFGANQMINGQSTNTSTPNFMFGTNTPQATSTAGSVFSSAMSKPQPQNVTFGTNSTSAVASSGFSATQQSTAPVFSVGTTSANSAFGAPSVSSSTPVFGNTPTPQNTTSVFGNTNTATPSVFGNTNTSTSSVFGNTNTGTSSVFGNTNTGTSSVFGNTNIQFGSSTQQPTNSTFGTATTQISSAASFGTQNVQSGSGFGSQTSNSMFGNTTKQSFTPVFGNVNSTAPATSFAPVFGNVTTTAPSSSFTPVFGNVTTTAPSSSFTPVFGNVNSTAPSTSSNNKPLFGQSAGPSVFGSTSTQSQSLFKANPSISNSTPLFGGSSGSTQSSGTPVFGGVPSTPQSTGTAVFGGVQATPQSTGTPIFGGASSNAQTPTTKSSIRTSLFGGPATSQASASPMFGGTTSQAGATPTFGGSNQPSFGQSNTANPFQASSTVTAPGSFGAPPSTSIQNAAGSSSGNAVFSFGGSSAAQTDNKGFQFGGTGSQGGSAAPTFNFGATPNSGATPAFGAAGGNMFSVGSGAATPKPRTIARPKRRGNRAR